MEVPVFVEPHPPGFRARTGAPLDLTADGPTPDEAVGAVHQLLQARLQAGGQIRAFTVPDIHSILDAARAVGENPWFEEWVRGVQEYRRAHNTPPDVD